MQSVVINRLKACLVVGALALLIVGSVRADDLPSPAPHMFDYDFPSNDLQLFSWRDVSPYGDGPQPNTGFFFSWDFMHMSVTKPDKAPIGVANNPEFTPRLIDTGTFINPWNQGNRFEGGWMKDNNKGMLFSGFKIHSLNDRLLYTEAPVLIFDNEVLIPEFPPIFGFQPFAQNPIFNELTAELSTHVWGGEAMRLWRFHRKAVPFFPVCEFMLGARYMDVRDRFDVNGRFTAVAPIDDDIVVITGDMARWQMRARNRMIGPQIGLRMYREHGPWGLNVESRFFAAFNYQKASLVSEFDPILYDDLLNTLFFPFGVPGLPTASNDSNHEVEWAPTVELQIGWHYLLTKAITLRVGANGTYVTQGIMRAPNKIDYSNLAPLLGSTSRLKPGENNMDLLAWGIFMGVEVNR